MKCTQVIYRRCFRLCNALIREIAGWRVRHELVEAICADKGMNAG